MEILEWINRHSCQVCYGNEGPTECDNWKEELGHNKNGPCAARLFADKGQLKGLIEEAEAGAHEWVRDNTLFVCGVDPEKEHLTCQECNSRTPHIYDSGIKGSYSCLIQKPFRGTPGEPQVFGTYVEASEVETVPKWGEDGYGCMTCKSLYIKSGCQHARYSACGIEEEYRMYKREEDRSDNEFNEKREDLRVKAGEMAEDDLEYAVIKTFTLRDLDATDISDQAFRHMYPFLEGSSCYLKTETLTTSAESTAKELLRLGFIEEKVVDPIVRLGDYFEYKDNIFKATWCGKRQLTLTSMFETEQYLSGGRLEDAEKANCDKINYTCHLSEIVGKDRLSEFKPVKVTVTEVE